jgi:hypothetical protein
MIGAQGVWACNNGPLFVYKDTYMNEGYIDDGFVGFPSFFISFELGTMRNSKESKKFQGIQEIHI